VTWEDRLLTDDQLGVGAQPHDGRFAARAVSLIDHQKRNWPLLEQGYRAFRRLSSRRLRPDPEGAEIVLQHNPHRIRSTAARIDSASVASRECFLCPQSLPVEEKGIAYGPELIVLCNPYPVLDNHLSIVHREHIEQKIDGNVETLLTLARDLAPDFFVLYNGPGCGASAPDHLHFQACSRDRLPIEVALSQVDDPQGERCEICDRGRQSFELFTLSDNNRTAIVFRGNNSQEIADWVYATLKELPLPEEASEPPVNIVCTHDRGDWTLFLFPRSRHRPSCFYSEKVIVSPGAIDMAGVIVLPRADDFERIGPAEIAEIYSEVSVDEDRVTRVLERLGLSEGAEELA
jgi:uncharacterized protein DUF4922